MTRLSQIVFICILLIGAACGPQPTPELPTLVPTDSPTQTSVPPSPTPFPTEVVPDRFTLDESQQAYLRFIHLAQSSDSVDLYVENLRMASFMNFEQFSDSMPIAAGTYNIRILAAGELGSAEAIYQQEISLAPQSHTILALTDNNGTLQYQLFNEDTQPISGQRSRLQWINLSPQAPLIDIQAEGYEDNVSYGQSNPPSQIISQDTEFTINGGNTSQTYQLNARPRSSYTIITAPTQPESGQPFKIHLLQQAVDGLSTIHVINTVAAIDNVDVYADDKKIAGSLGYLDGSPDESILALPYTIRVYPQDANPAETDALISTQVFINPDEIVTLVLAGDGDKLNIVAANDNAKPTAADSARILFINARPDIPMAEVSINHDQSYQLNFATTSPSIEVPAEDTVITWYAVEKGQRGTTLQDTNLVLEEGRTYVYIFATEAHMNPLLYQGVVSSLPPEIKDLSGSLIDENATYPAKLRVINAIRGLATTLEVDGITISQSQEYGTASDYVLISDGFHSVVLRRADTLDPLASLDLDLAEGITYSLIAYESGENGHSIYIMDNELFRENFTSANIRLTNLTSANDTVFGLSYAPALGPVTQPLEEEGYRQTIPIGLTPLIPETQPLTSSWVYSIVPSTWDLNIIDTTDRDKIASILAATPLEANHSYDIIAFEFPASPQVTGFIIESGQP